ncbi:MAG: hypothetical protein ACKV2Q_31360 [Planctomycetaceae bacterium]
MPVTNTLDVRDHDTLDTLRSGDSSAPPASGCRNFAVGCGCAAGALLLVAVAIGIWVAMNWKALTADFTKKIAADVVAQSTLAAEDKARVLKRINQLADDFKDGKVSQEQLGKVIEEIAKSPLLPISLLMMADEKYIKPSGLSSDDQEAGRRTLQRFARGAFEKSIADSDVNEVMKLLTERQADGSEKLKERLTDAELEAFLDKAQEKADAANVPDEPFEVNIADELDKAIDNVLKP